MIIKLHLLSVCLVFFGVISCKSQNGRAGVSIKRDFKILLEEIREQKIPPDSARMAFHQILGEIKAKYPPAPYDSANMQLVFPLKGSNYKSVGGKGRGYYARHFDLFNHEIAKSHPAHDIFIYDPDKDCIDNRTNEYTDIVSVSDGVVIATETNWTEDNGYKGGNYVWIYDTESGGLWYYAHQRKVYVEPGQMVKKGNKIGEVGRSGFNADANRSDTHLHLMYLHIDENLNPHPVNHYPWLKKAKTVYEAELPPPLRNKTNIDPMQVRSPGFIRIHMPVIKISR